LVGSSEQHHVRHVEDQAADDHALPLAARDDLQRLLLVLAGKQQLAERGAHDQVVLPEALAAPARHPFRQRFIKNKL
jgi:hypothetical protein